MHNLISQHRINFGNEIEYMNIYNPDCCQRDPFLALGNISVRGLVKNSFKIINKVKIHQLSELQNKKARTHRHITIEAKEQKRKILFKKVCKK